MASESDSTPVTQQIGRNVEWSSADLSHTLHHPDLEIAASCLLRDRNGKSFEFRDLYKEKAAIIIFVRKADVRLIVIGQSSYLHIQNFCSITGYHHEIYVDNDREVYSKLGMKRGETSTSSAGSPHVKSNVITGSIKSIWRAITSPAFDFQGDPAQQGGALIVGPGNRVHFLHRDMNRYDHVPISSLLRYAGVQTIHFGHQRPMLEV
ncbi:peroxiredoxin-like 2C isoform X2 [Rana temporaria]|uniref:peroxiredoxin-like 2C isoform X2 n=1 Tax=Rana temporaria TaxID=8407 RepID=UPI001AAD7283|nr:peroxiredoxin-like 2C isoform X2 [Rana temporaria]